VWVEFLVFAGGRRAILGPSGNALHPNSALRAIPGESSGIFSRSHALRGNAVKGALRRELSAF